MITPVTNDVFRKMGFLSSVEGWMGKHAQILFTWNSIWAGLYYSKFLKIHASHRVFLMQISRFLFMENSAFNIGTCGGRRSK